MAKIPKEAIIYDLYCGTGTLGICAAKLAKQVVGIEISPEAALDARENAKINGVDNIEILTGDVGKVLHQIKRDGTHPLPDIVMVDPPRAGLDSKAMQSLLELRPAKILYISCNPLTQAANVAELQQDGYSVECIQPVDQFPQTPHVENIVVLSLPRV
jgi:23S rRNA (uracil1939-C5)-methyltransferase